MSRPLTIEDLIPMTVALHKAGVLYPEDDPMFCNHFYTDDQGRRVQPKDCC